MFTFNQWQIVHLTMIVVAFIKHDPFVAAAFVALMIAHTVKEMRKQP